MATIGKLSIMLTASAAQFVSGVKKAASATAGLTQKLSGLVSFGGALKTALGGLAVGGLVAMGVKAVKAAADMVRTARLANTSAAGFATLEHAMKLTGGETEAVARGLQRLNELFSGLGPDAQYASDLFQRFGVNMNALAAGGGYDAVKKIADAVAATKDPLQKAALASAAFGADAGAWLPILGQGAAGIDKLAEQAKKLGLTFSQIDASTLERANSQLNEMDSIVTGISRQSAVQLSNVFVGAGDSVRHLADEVGSMGTLVKGAFRAIALAIAHTWDGAEKGLMYLVGAFSAGFQKLVALTAQALSKILSLTEKITPDAMGGKALREASNAVKAFADDWDQSARNVVEGTRDAVASQNLAGEVEKYFDSLDVVAKRSTNNIKFMNKLAANGGVQAWNRYKAAIAGFSKVFQENQTPFEGFTNKLKELDTFLSATGGWDTYARGVAKAVNELEKAHGLSEVKLPAGLTRESSAAVSQINQQEALNNRRFRESPQERVKRIMEQSLEVERQQQEYLRRIAEALRPSQPVRI